MNLKSTIAIKHLLATIYDVFILATLCFISTFVLVACRQGQAIPPENHWYQFSLISLMLFYYLFSYRFGGQTIGMKSWHVKLHNLNQNQLTIRQSLFRILLTPIVYLCFPIFFTSPQRLLTQWTNTQLTLNA